MDGIEPIVTRVVELLRPPTERCTIIGVGGPVAVGKSTFAAALADAIRVRAPGEVVTVSTDGFLFTNEQLARRGALERKGEPDTFDLARLALFVSDVRRGVPGLVVPVYSHEAYDVVGEGVPLGSPAVVLLEGIVALDDRIAGALDLSVYLDAAPENLEAWFVDRLLRLVEELPEDSASILSLFRPLDAESRRAAAVATWEAVNVPNNRANIEPTRRGADLVVRKGGDHRILGIGPPG